MSHIDTTAIAKRIGNVLYGLDDHAADIVTKVVTYTEFQNAFQNPLIINLWGPTGAGKTEMVRMLVRELGFEDMYFNLNAANASTSKWDKKFKEIAERVGMTYLFADRVDDYEGEEDDDDFSVLLDDDDEDFDEDFDEEAEGGVTKLDSLLNELQDLTRGSKKGAADEGRSLNHERSEASEATGAANRVVRRFRDELLERANARRSRADAKIPVILFIDEFQNARSLDREGNEILRGGINEIWGILDKGIEYLTGEHYPTIIFTAGNIELDEDEQVANWQGTYSKDTGEHYLDLDVIQEALSYRFRPEMIARLRTNHYYFGPISYEVALRIMKRDLVPFFKAIESEFNLEREMSVDEKLLISLIDEFSIRGMGARGVESLLNQKITSHLYAWITRVREAGQDPSIIRRIDIGGTARQVCVTMQIEGHGPLVVKYNIAPPPPEPEPINHQLLAVQAIHEAGHAVASYLLYGMTPYYVRVGNFTSRKGGSTYCRVSWPVKTRRSIFEDMAVTLGGYVAERIHFGKQNMSPGSSGDLNEALKLAGQYLYKYGFGNSLLVRSITYESSSSGLGPFNTDTEDRAEAVELIEEAVRLTERLLNSQLNLLRAIAQASYFKGRIDSSEIQDLILHWLDRSALEQLRKDGDIRLRTHAGIEIGKDEKPIQFDYVDQLFGGNAESAKPYALALGPKAYLENYEQQPKPEDFDPQAEFNRRMFPIQDVA